MLGNGDCEKYFGVMCKEVGNPGCVCRLGASTVICETGGLDCRGLILRNEQAQSVGKCRWDGLQSQTVSISNLTGSSREAKSVGESGTRG